MNEDKIEIKVHKDSYKIVIIKANDSFSIGVLQLDDDNIATIRNVYLNEKDLKDIAKIFEAIENSLKEETNG